MVLKLPKERKVANIAVVLLCIRHLDTYSLQLVPVVLRNSVWDGPVVSQLCTLLFASGVCANRRGSPYRQDMPMALWYRKSFVLRLACVEQDQFRARVCVASDFLGRLGQ